MSLLGTVGGQAAGLIFYLAAFPFLFMVWFRRAFHPDTYIVIATIYAFLYLAGSIALLIYNTGKHDWAWVAINLACIAFTIYWFWNQWRRWKNRKKFLKAIGSKTRAIIDKMLRNLRRESQPEGAR